MKTNPCCQDDNLQSRAAEYLAGRLHSIACSTSAVIGRTMMNGLRSVAKVGRIRRCCPISKSQNGLSMVRTPIMAAEGPLQVRTSWSNNPLYSAFLLAGRDAGYPFTPDYNGAHQEGFSRLQHNVTMKGRRCSASVAFLHPIRHRQNLTVCTGVQVTGVVLSGRRAVGVAFLRRGREERAVARAELFYVQEPIRPRTCSCFQGELVSGAPAQAADEPAPVSGWIPAAMLSRVRADMSAVGTSGCIEPQARLPRYPFDSRPGPRIARRTPISTHQSRRSDSGARWSRQC